MLDPVVLSFQHNQDSLTFQSFNHTNNNINKLSTQTTRQQFNHNNNRILFNRNIMYKRIKTKTS